MPQKKITETLLYLHCNKSDTNLQENQQIKPQYTQLNNYRHTKPTRKPQIRHSEKTKHFHILGLVANTFLLVLYYLETKCIRPLAHLQNRAHKHLRKQETMVHYIDFSLNNRMNLYQVNQQLQKDTIL